MKNSLTTEITEGTEKNQLSFFLDSPLGQM
jgi:hypothetical protein